MHVCTCVLTHTDTEISSELWKDERQSCWKMLAPVPALTNLFLNPVSLSTYDVLDPVLGSGETRQGTE